VESQSVTVVRAATRSGLANDFNDVRLRRYSDVTGKSVRNCATAHFKTRKQQGRDHGFPSAAFGRNQENGKKIKWQKNRRSK
jgi:hypothetical protein